MQHHDAQDDHFRDECGVFGVSGHAEAANLTYLGLCALQHRGQESAGIVSSDGRTLAIDKEMGLVADVFSAERLARLPGTQAIGHVRYSTAGGSEFVNAQPLVIDSHRGQIAMCHNGNLVNARHKRKELEGRGSIFSTTSDTEVILHLVAKSGYKDTIDAIVHALSQMQGAYSLLFVLQRERAVIAVRDPMGFRPLSIGRHDGAVMFASETCAFDLVGATFERDVEPGEMVIVDADGMHSRRPFQRETPRPCIFEYVYFSRPDSVVFGRPVAKVRKRLGRQLALEQPADADLVVPVPDSGMYAALGYSEGARIPFELGMVRNHYIGRTFIEPKQSIRNFGVKLKLNPSRSLLSGRRVVLVDDSIVRGTTSKKIVSMVRQAGAAEVHVRISSPPTVGPCFYGIDTPRRDELIANRMQVEQIRRYLGADSLGYLSHEGMLSAVDIDRTSFCSACFNNDYPIDTSGRDKTAQLDLFQLQADLEPEPEPEPAPEPEPEPAT